MTPITSLWMILQSSLLLACWIQPAASFVLPVQNLSPVSFRESSSSFRHVAVDTHHEDEFSVSKTASDDDSSHNKHNEYAALSPGSTVRIQVGDVTLARKAWKKRRRSGSPLLVPCSVLDVDRKSMTRRNIVYLLQKFGTPLAELPEHVVGFMPGTGDMAISMEEINRLYKHHLGTSLAKHAKALGHETARSLVRELFNRQVQQDYGIRVWLPPKEEHGTGSADDRPLWLMAPLSRRRAHGVAAQAGLLQFVDAATEEDPSRIGHTGIVRSRRKGASSKKNCSPHEFLPLSAAMRVTQGDLDSGIVKDGSIHTAVVFSFDLLGDGGSPLLTLSLHPTRGQVRDRLKMKAASRRHFATDRRLDRIRPEEIETRLEDMKVGEGPLVGKVMHISTRSGAAFIDCGVGRTVAKSKGGGTARVLGMLRFDDLLQLTMEDEPSFTLENRSTMTEEEADLIESAMYDDEDDDWEDDDEDDLTMLDDLYSGDEDDVSMASVDDGEFEFEEGDEDITHLVTINEDGDMVYTDPDTGVTNILDHDHDHDDEEGEAEDENEIFDGLSPEQRFEKLGSLLSRDNSEEDDEEEGEDDPEVQLKETNDSFSPSFINVGDELGVYVKSVLKQSGRFMVTVDPSVKDRKARDIKRETEAEKRLSRLVAKMGGEDGYQKIMQLEGTQCEGVVKATSKTGDWFYVQPMLEGLPVGVAKIDGDTSSISIAEGDSVRVRLEGIDESRGQLAMTIIP